jgi:hypothetical protein
VDELIQEGQRALVVELLSNGWICAVLSDRLEVPTAGFVVDIIFEEVKEV